MSSYPFFIPGFVLCTNSSLFSFKIANEPSEFRNYLLKDLFPCNTKCLLSRPGFAFYGRYCSPAPRSTIKSVTGCCVNCNLWVHYMPPGTVSQYRNVALICQNVVWLLCELKLSGNSSASLCPGNYSSIPFNLHSSLALSTESTPVAFLMGANSLLRSTSNGRQFSIS